MKKNNAKPGILYEHMEAKSNIREFNKSEDYNTDEQMMGWGKHEAFWGGLWGMLFGSALFVVGSALFVLPDIGPLLVFGPPASWVVGILGGAIVVGGLSTLAAALLDTGSPEKSCPSHETAKGKSLLESSGASQIDAHRSMTSSIS